MTGAVAGRHEAQSYLTGRPRRPLRPIYTVVNEESAPALTVVVLISHRLLKPLSMLVAVVNAFALYFILIHAGMGTSIR